MSAHMLLPPSPNSGDETPVTPQQAEAAFGRPYAEVLTTAERHTLGVQRWLPAQAAGATTEETPHTTLVTNGAPARMFNYALGMHTDALPPEQINVVVGEVVRKMNAAAPAWTWWIGPGDLTPPLMQALTSAGLTASALPTLAAPLPVTPPPTPDHIRVWHARTIDDLAAASHIRSSAFRFPNGVGEAYFLHRPGAWLRSDPARIILAAERGSLPASMGVLIEAEGAAGIYIMATLAESRRRGLGGAVLAELLRQATALGHDLCILTASPLGYPLYREYGFRYLFDFGLFKA